MKVFSRLRNLFKGFMGLFVTVIYLTSLKSMQARYEDHHTLIKG